MAEDTLQSSVLGRESIGTDSTESYQIEWDTTPLENESQHTLSAYVTDDAGHTTIAQPILVTISN